MPRKANTLSEQEKLFIDEYLIDLNATQAAIRAGYSQVSARQLGYKLLKKKAVVAGIQEAVRKRQERTHISQDRVIKEFARIAFSNMKDFCRWGSGGVDLKEAEDVSEDDSACIQEVSESMNQHGGARKIKLHDKVRALEWLAAHLGMEAPKQGDDKVIRVFKVAYSTDEEKKP